MKTDWLTCLPRDLPWREQILSLEEVESTNTLAKEMVKNGAKHGTVVIADSQTGGRGRMGRSFQSPAGQGIYMSLILRYPVSPDALMHLTCATAVYLRDALAEIAPIEPQIKWTNDIIHQKKKLAGILTELVITGQETCAIVGIGLNVCQNSMDFLPEIRSIATSLQLILDEKVAREAVFAKILQNLHRMDSALLTDRSAIMDRYRQHCATIGQEVSVLRGEDVRHGLALSVTEDGALLVRYTDGSEEAVNSGEVSIRGMYGYL